MTRKPVVYIEDLIEIGQAKSDLQANQLDPNADQQGTLISTTDHAFGTAPKRK